MSNRKRPEGKAWEDFVDQWYLSDHIGKVNLSATAGVSYDTAKHWISEGGATRKQDDGKARMTISVSELLSIRPSTHLDFVCFDLETSNLQADFSILLTACIKPFGRPVIVFRADDYPAWAEERANDYDITKAISDELRKHAIVVGHYSSGFDIPYLRAKMTKHGLEPLPQMFGVDAWKIARDNFKVSSRRLGNLANFFALGEKELVEGELWMEAAYNGAGKAMDRIVAHNIKDVKILEALACISFPYLKSIPKL